MKPYSWLLLCGSSKRSAGVSATCCARCGARHASAHGYGGRVWATRAGARQRGRAGGVPSAARRAFLLLSESSFSRVAASCSGVTARAQRARSKGAPRRSACCACPGRAPRAAAQHALFTCGTHSVGLGVSSEAFTAQRARAQPPCQRPHTARARSAARRHGASCARAATTTMCARTLHRVRHGEGLLDHCGALLALHRLAVDLVAHHRLHVPGAPGRLHGSGTRGARTQQARVCDGAGAAAADGVHVRG
jgi:hypothetical protein